MEVLEAVLGRKKKEFEEKFWETQAKTETECKLPSVHRVMEKISRVCQEHGLNFRHKRPVAGEGSSRKAGAKKSGKEKGECRPKRWESSEERAGPSLTQSQMTGGVTDKAASPRLEYRNTRSTFDSSQAANSFFADGIDIRISSKVEGLSECPLEGQEAEWGEPFLWATPTARKQSENYHPESMAESLLTKPHPGAVKSKSQKRLDPQGNRSYLDSKTMTDCQLVGKQAPFLKIIGTKKDRLATSPRGKAEVLIRRPIQNSSTRLTQLDELLIKCVHVHAETTKRRRSRFQFCQEGTQSPEKAAQAPVRTLIEDLVDPEAADEELSSATDTKSRLASFAEQKLKFTKF